MSEPRKIVTLTERAAERAEMLLSGREAAIGLRVGVRNAGCSDLAYTMDFAEDVRTGEEVVEDRGITIVVDPKAILYLVGCEMDWVDEKMASRFVFNNPNETGRCGCGESFTVDRSRA